MSKSLADCPSSEHQRATALPFVAGFAAALLSSGIYLAANVLPFYDHWHGWLVAETGLWPVTRENTPGWIYLDSVGWPFPYRAAYDSNASEGFPTGLFDPAAMAADALIWLLLSASIAFVVERWVRRTERGVDFEWKSVAMGTLSVVITCWIFGVDELLGNWSDIWFWFLSVACGLYAGLLLVSCLMAWLASLV